MRFLSASNETELLLLAPASPVAQSTAKSFLPGGSCLFSLIQITELCIGGGRKKKESKRRRRREWQGYTYKIILNFRKLDPQLFELCGQELGEVEAGGLGGRAGGGQGAGSQEQQEQGWAGLHAATASCSPLGPALGSIVQEGKRAQSAAFTLMEPLIYTLKTSLNFLSPFPGEQYWGFKSFIKTKCHLGFPSTWVSCSLDPPPLLTPHQIFCA